MQRGVWGLGPGDRGITAFHSTRVTAPCRASWPGFQEQLPPYHSKKKPNKKKSYLKGHWQKPACPLEQCNADLYCVPSYQLRGRTATADNREGKRASPLAGLLMLRYKDGHIPQEPHREAGSFAVNPSWKAVRLGHDPQRLGHVPQR